MQFATHAIGEGSRRPGNALHNPLALVARIILFTLPRIVPALAPGFQRRVLVAIAPASARIAPVNIQGHALPIAFMTMSDSSLMVALPPTR